MALLTVLLVVGVGAAALVYSLTTPAKLTIESDKRTAAAMAQVRDALIGWSASRIPVPLILPNARPGELPCPDTNNDGFEEGNCVAGAIGRVPWKTLGIPEPKDGSGETLWYTFSGSFRIWNTNPNPVNSDTAGQLTITGTVPAANVIAIVFSPGSVTGAQNRSDTTTSLCSTTGTNILNNLCAANYLEGENANGDTTYTTALASDTFNDTLLPLTSDALFNVVNIRVAKETMAALDSYRAANAYYPFANAYGTAAPYNCTNGLTRGRFPITPGGCGQTAWGGSLPAWFAPNNWNLVTHYALSTSCQQHGISALLSLLVPGIGGILQGLCDTAGSLGGLGAVLGVVLALLGIVADEPITVTGIGTARALVIVTGRATGAQVHPCGSAAQCMEDAENTNNDATYAKPSRFPASNDRMAVTCVSNTPCAVLP